MLVGWAATAGRSSSDPSLLDFVCEGGEGKYGSGQGEVESFYINRYMRNAII